MAGRSRYPRYDEHVAALMKRGNLSQIQTATGTALIEAVPEIIRSPAMTAEWEQKLLQVEKSQMHPEKFMREIAALVKYIVQETGQKELAQTADLWTRGVGTFGTASTETATVPKRRC